MMDEISALHRHLNPVETLFVVDAMTGQDAANTAKAFNEALPLTGVVLTKADGDARAVPRCQFGISQASQSNLSVPGKKLTVLSRSIRTVLPPAFLVWGMCSR